MTRDDIIRMAREAGIVSPEETGEVWCAGEWQLHEFANLVAAAMAIDSTHTCHAECQRPSCVAVREAVAAEREECAKVLDDLAAKDKLSNYYKVAALRIRERGAP